MSQAVLPSTSSSEAPPMSTYGGGPGDEYMRPAGSAMSTCAEPRSSFPSTWEGVRTSHRRAASTRHGDGRFVRPPRRGTEKDRRGGKGRRNRRWDGQSPKAAQAWGAPSSPRQAVAGWGAATAWRGLDGAVFVSEGRSPTKRRLALSTTPDGAGASLPQRVRPVQAARAPAGAAGLGSSGPPPSASSPATALSILACLQPRPPAH